MGKNVRGHKEYSKEQKIRHENERLKREVGSLRKQLARIDLDRYSHIKEIVEEHYHNEEKQEIVDSIESLKQIWKCHDCTDGHLAIFLYNRPDGTHYYRKCENCQKRTPSKRYSKAVKGIVKNPQVASED